MIASMKTITEWKSQSGLAVDLSLEEDALRHIAGCCRQPEQSWIREPKCEIRPSRRHGLGLFATQDVKVWEVITLYPADGARLWLPDGAHTIHLKRFTGMDTDTCVDYSANVPSFGSFPVDIVGDPTKLDDPFYLGHMANDVCKMTNFDQRDIYNATSRKGMSAAIGLLPFNAITNKSRFQALALYAMKNIRAGEEIMIHYGDDYWAGKMKWEDNRPKIDLQAMD